LEDFGGILEARAGGVGLGEVEDGGAGAALGFKKVRQAVSEQVPGQARREHRWRATSSIGEGSAAVPPFSRK
jgi:hypothetical protein